MTETSLEKVLRLAGTGTQAPHAGGIHPVRAYRRFERGRAQQVRQHNQGPAWDRYRAAVDAVTKGPTFGSGLDAPPLTPPSATRNLPGNRPTRPWNPSSEFKRALDRLHGPTGHDQADVMRRAAALPESETKPIGGAPANAHTAAEQAADRAAAQNQTENQPAHRDWISPTKWKEGQQVWKERGQSTYDHIAQMHSLANRVALHHTEAARAIDRAADAMTAGRHRAAAGHLDNAAFLLRAAGHHDVAGHVERVRDAIPKVPAFGSGAEHGLGSLGPGRNESPGSAFQGEAATPSSAAINQIGEYMKAHPQEAARHVGVTFSRSG